MSFKLIVFQGPSGSGKSTLQAILGLPRIVTWTSRAPRPGEVDGQDYHFAGREQLEMMYEQQKMLEMAEYQGNYYGTSIAAIQSAADRSEPSAIVMEAGGAQQIKALLQDKALIIGVTASMEQCRQRLINRGTSAAELERRLRTYEEEIRSLMLCDIVIHNSDGNRMKSAAIMKLIGQGMVGTANEL
ncbi:Guanylate kinase [Paenibacillus plantiphilus]|uniref:Guanylate kinase n=1 Tax=Paenibacillus plantiphilus TaxID=2905650 RepID=A0ABM9CTE1_9BACL|nr:guanylate kinase [Paenibacillus plantiphilus]CAH1221909.1 Guanylate kinase [Paenibacillus plantiphilus]